MQFSWIIDVFIYLRYAPAMVSRLDTEKNEAMQMGKKEGKGKANAPGQLKKAAGEKSAKPFAPGQKKEKKEGEED